MLGTPRKNRSNVSLDEEIDRNLSRAYMNVVNEPVPDRLKNLLEQLRQQERSDSPSPEKAEDN